MAALQIVCDEPSRFQLRLHVGASSRILLSFRRWHSKWYVHRKRQTHGAKAQAPRQKADEGHLPSIASASAKAVDSVVNAPWYSVGIVADVAGMFKALIFDDLNENVGLNMTYEIVEAIDEDNVGGRFYAYNTRRSTVLF